MTWWKIFFILLGAIIIASIFPVIKEDRSEWLAQKRTQWGYNPIAEDEGWRQHER